MNAVISVEIHNQRTMTLSQSTHDGEITLTTRDHHGEVDGNWTITPGELVLMLNYCRVQKAQTVKLTLTPIGRDDWDRPVYDCGGKFYVDVAPRKNLLPEIYTKLNNSFYGEPCDPVHAEFEFVPERDTWNF